MCCTVDSDEESTIGKESAVRGEGIEGGGYESIPGTITNRSITVTIHTRIQISIPSRRQNGTISSRVGRCQLEHTPECKHNAEHFNKRTTYWLPASDDFITSPTWHSWDEIVCTSCCSIVDRLTVTVTIVRVKDTGYPCRNSVSGDYSRIFRYGLSGVLGWYSRCQIVTGWWYLTDVFCAVRLRGYCPLQALFLVCLYPISSQRLIDFIYLLTSKILQQ